MYFNASNCTLQNVVSFNFMQLQQRCTTIHMKIFLESSSFGSHLVETFLNCWKLLKVAAQRLTGTFLATTSIVNCFSSMMTRSTTATMSGVDHVWSLPEPDLEHRFQILRTVYTIIVMKSSLYCFCSFYGYQLGFLPSLLNDITTSSEAGGVQKSLPTVCWNHVRHNLSLIHI